MGKYTQQNVQYQQQQSLDAGNRQSSRFFCQRCSAVLSRLFSLRCLVVLVLSFAVLLSGFFWLLPHRSKSQFDAKEQIKLSASVQACFRIQKPVSKVVPHIARLEQDIFDEIALPNTKVAVLSMHQLGASNWTDVQFAVLPVPLDSAISQASLSLLRSSFTELFVQQLNLTLTTPIFGQPTLFQILKFPGGITVIPLEANPISEVPEILFNFILNNSISEIQDSFVQLKNQLKFGLRLRPYESVYVQLMNDGGSTVSPPVTVQASVMSSMGNLLPQRLKQLARIIKASHANNLGLNDSIFGEVRSIILSTYLKGKLHAAAPASAPAPSPQKSVSPSCSPSSNGYLHATVYRAGHSDPPFPP